MTEVPIDVPAEAPVAVAPDELDAYRELYDNAIATRAPSPDAILGSSPDEAPQPPSIDSIEATGETEDHLDEDRVDSPAEDSERPVTNDESIQSAAAEQPPDAEPPAHAVSSNGAPSAIDHVLGLMDQVRSLIPGLRGTSATDNAPHVAAILAGAEVPAAEPDSLSQLRAAIVTASERPRDIDVMLDLVSRAGAIRDLLAERDRYAATISKALTALDANPE